MGASAYYQVPLFIWVVLILDLFYCSFVTVSWNIFTEHYKGSLVGHSDNNAAEDTGHLRLVIISSISKLIALTLWIPIASPTSKNDGYV